MAFEQQRTDRARKAMWLIRRFLLRHMHGQDVRIGKSINERIWARGIQKPPRKIRVHALLEGKTVYAELVGIEIKPPTKEEVKRRAERLAEKIARIRKERKERRKKGLEEKIKEEKEKAERPRAEVKRERKKEAKPEEKKEAKV